jgi:hypothetical protein
MGKLSIISDFMERVSKASHNISICMLSEITETTRIVLIENKFPKNRRERCSNHDLI